MDKLENVKDKVVGKAIETAGRVTNDQELEFTGKFRTMTTEVKDKLYKVKEEVYQEANNILDRTKEEKQNK